MGEGNIPRVQAQKREKLCSRATKRLRESGRLPAVIYGHGEDNAHVSLDRKEVLDVLFEQGRLFEVSLPERTEPCLVNEIQWDHLGAHVLHLDLTRVSLHEKVTVEVELELIGEAPGLSEAGAYLHQERTAVEVECAASQIPQSLPVDISSLEHGQAITVGDLSLPKGTRCTLDPEETLVSIAISHEEPEPEPAAEGEPEVIGESEESGASEGESSGDQEG